MKSLIALCLLVMPLCAAAEDTYIDLWQLHQEAQGADPRILRAQARIHSGEGNERAALGQLLPQLNASGSVNRGRRDDDLSRIQYNGKRMAVALSQVIYDPQVWRSYQKYVELARQTEYESDDTQVQSSIDLSERYFAVLAAEDELSLVRSELDATERNLKRVNALYARQMAMVTDTLDLEARVDALKADEIEAGNKVQISREAISELVGVMSRSPSSVSATTRPSVCRHKPRTIGYRRPSTATRHCMPASTVSAPPRRLSVKPGPVICPVWA